MPCAAAKETLIDQRPRSRRLRCAAGQRVPGKFSRAHFTVGVQFDDREELMLLITLISAEKNFDDSVCD